MFSPLGSACTSAGLPMTAWSSPSLAPTCRPRPSTLAQEASRNAKARAKLLALAGLGSEVLLEFVGFTFVLIRIRGRGALARDVRPLDGELGVHLEPFFRLAVGVGEDGIGRALGLADAAVDALVGVDHQHLVALVEAIDCADLDAVHVLALDAVFGNDVSHLIVLSDNARFRGADYRT